MLVALPLTYGSPWSYEPMQIASASCVIFGCGIMALAWGQAVMEALAKTGL